MVFTRLATFKFKNNYYEMFITGKNKRAFLRVENGKYHYPSIEEFTNIVGLFEFAKSNTIAFYQDSRHKKYNFTPYVIENVKGKTKKIMLTSLVVFTLLTGCGIDSDSYTYSNEYLPIDTGSSYDSNDAVDYEYTSTESAFYETEDFELLESAKSIDLYNNKYFDQLFECKNIEIEKVIATKNSNTKMPAEFNSFIDEFIYTMESYYGSLDWRVFNYNIETLEFERTSSDNVDFVMGGSVALYDFKNNKMLISEDLDLNDPKSRLIFRHELGHLFNHLRMQKDGYDIKYGFDNANRGTYLKEALTVIFTTDPFMYDYESKEITDNMGYPIITNIVRVLVECSGYDIRSSITDNVYYFQNLLDKEFSSSLDASLIEELIEIQWIEYSTDLIQVDDEDYKDLYRYVANAYISKKLNSSMSYEEILEMQNNLKERLLLGVKEEKYVYTDIIDEEFSNYIELNNISIQSTRKM